MNTTNTYLRFKSKPNIEGIRKSIKNNRLSYQGSFIQKTKHIDGQTVNLVLKNHTNYLSVCPKLWILPIEEVCQELIAFYNSVIDLDPSLAENCKWGFQQHIKNYKHHNNRAKEIKLQKA